MISKYSYPNPSILSSLLYHPHILYFINSSCIHSSIFVKYFINYFYMFVLFYYSFIIILSCY